MKMRLFLCTMAFMLCLYITAQPRQWRQFPDTLAMVHDPVMAFEGDTTYLFATGINLQRMASVDRVHWTVQREGVLDTIPAWTHDSVPGFRNHIWAPDVMEWHGQWWLTYSCSTFGKNTSAIGLMSAPRLSKHHWTDLGCLLSSRQHRDEYNAIDPNLIVDEHDCPWLVFGSFWDGIQLIPLQLVSRKDIIKTGTIADSMLAMKEGSHPVTIARRYDVKRQPKTENPTSRYAGVNAIEAPFLFYHAGYYYLFASWDYCCRGAQSTYRVVVGRSRQVSGPYLDREGKSMTSGGGTPVISGDGKQWEAAGHCAVYHIPHTDRDLFICHGYSIPYEGMSLLIQREITWADGWPCIANDMK